VIARASPPLRTPASFAIALAIGLSTTALHGALEGPASAQHVTERVTATATFAPRASLQVSTQVLRFDVIDAAIPALATVEFVAGVRTRIGGDVRLIVEVTDLAAVPSGSAGQALTIVGGTDGMTPGDVSPYEPTVVGRWAGGGLRSGRVTFRLLAAPGVYLIPINFRVDAL
jgi:hypothetical protein